MRCKKRSTTALQRRLRRFMRLSRPYFRDVSAWMLRDRRAGDPERMFGGEMGEEESRQRQQSNELLSLFFFVRGFFPFRLGAALDLLAFSNLLPLSHLTKKKRR